MKENYRGRAVSLWLNLLPKLEQSGGYQAGGGGGGGRPHGMLTGATWGLVRNTTNVPGVQQISLNDKVSSGQLGLILHFRIIMLRCVLSRWGLGAARSPW